MTTKNDVATVINDLILINNDRIVGYEKAIDNLDEGDMDLKNIFEQMANQSRDYKNELADEVRKLGEAVSDGTTNSGKIYRTWMDIKATFSGDDRQTALNNCEFGEDAAQKAYKEALEDDDLNNGMISQIISKQKESLKASHDKIKALRDAHKDK